MSIYIDIGDIAPKDLSDIQLDSMIKNIEEIFLDSVDGKHEELDELHKELLEIKNNI